MVEIIHCTVKYVFSYEMNIIYLNIIVLKNIFGMRVSKVI